QQWNFGANQRHRIASGCGELADDRKVSIARTVLELAKAKLVEDDIVDELSVGFVRDCPIDPAPSESARIARPHHRIFRPQDSDLAESLLQRSLRHDFSDV